MGRGQYPPRRLTAWERVQWYGWEVTDTDCWEFRGPRDVRGYGRIKLLGPTVKVHRVSYEHFHGPLGDRMVRHACDNPPCMNPAHLESGYALENNRDRADRGRSGRMFGTSNPAAKLTMDEVREIRALQGLKTQDELAAAFGVRQSTVSDTLSGRRYPETEAA